MARPRARIGCFGDDSCAEASLLQTEARHGRKQTLLPVFGGSVQLRCAGGKGEEHVGSRDPQPGFAGAAVDSSHGSEEFLNRCLNGVRPDSRASDPP